MAKYNAVGGTVTFPNDTVFKVVRGTGSKRALTVENTTGPGDSGNVEYCTGNYTYSAQLSGFYQSNSTDTLDDDISGTCNIDWGEGERWAGNCVVRNVTVAPNWTGGGPIPVAMTVLWTGAVTITQPS